MVIELTTLRDDHKEAIIIWFRSFLSDHLKWWKAVFGKQVSLRNELDEQQWRLLKDASTSEHDFVCIAQTYGNPIGVIWTRVKNDDWLDCRVGQLNWLAVAPHARRAGVGRKLLQEADMWFAAKKVSGKYLYVAEQNKIAIDLYEEFGYKITDYRMIGRV